MTPDEFDRWLGQQALIFQLSLRGRAADARRHRLSRDAPPRSSLSIYLDGALAAQGCALTTDQLEALCLHLEDQV